MQQTTAKWLALGLWSASMFYAGHKFSPAMGRLEDKILYLNAPPAVGSYKKPYDLSIKRELIDDHIQVFLYDENTQTKIPLREDLYPPTGDMLQQMAIRSKDAATCDLPRFFSNVAERVAAEAIRLQVFK